RDLSAADVAHEIELGIINRHLGRGTGRGADVQLARTVVDQAVRPLRAGVRELRQERADGGIELDAVGPPTADGVVALRRNCDALGAIEAAACDSADDRTGRADDEDIALIEFGDDVIALEIDGGCERRAMDLPGREDAQEITRAIDNSNSVGEV